nr:integrase, catalytic region, zinc finger, CCHC-type, peptidase aspartic, catalytic [Tanacetum cinerariifolium]
MLLTEALEPGAYLDLKQLAFLVDNADTIIPAQASQEILTPAAFQTDDLDAFDFDCDDVPSARQFSWPIYPPMNKMFSQRTSLGYQNPFYLSQARRKVPALYDGHNIVKTHVPLSVTDTEETLELAEEKHTYWLPILQPVVAKPPVLSEPILKKEFPRELPPISLYFEHDLHKELKEMKSIFSQMETEVAKFSVDEKYLEIEKKELSLDNDRLLEHIIFQDVINVVMHADVHNEHIVNTKGKNVVESVQNVHNSNVVTSKVYKLDLPPLSPCIKNNIAAHVDYLKHTQANVDTLRKIGEDARELRPLDSNLAFACTFVTRIQKLLVYVSATCLSTKNVSYKLVAVTPMNKTRKVSRTNRTLVPRLGLLQAYDRASLSAHKLVSKFLGTVRFRNDQIAKIIDYGDYQLGNVIISRVYYVEGLGHNLFSIGQFCDSDLEVAFRKPTRYVLNLNSADLLSGSRDTNLYTISLDDMLKSSPICFLSKASKTKSWPMRVESINGKKYILVIVNDYSRFTWVKCLHSKDEAPEFSSGPAPQLMTLGTLCSGLVPNPISQPPYVPPTKNDWDILFQPMFDELFNPPPSVVSLVLAATTRRPADPTGSPVSTSLEHDAPSASTSSTQEQEHSLIISQGVEESPKHHNFINPLHEDSTSRIVVEYATIPHSI